MKSLTMEAEAAKALIENLGDVVADDVDLRMSAIEGETNFYEALDKALERMAELDGLIEGMSGAIMRLEARSARLETQRDRLRIIIAAAVEQVGETRIERPAATLTLSNKPPSIMVIDEAAIPPTWWKTGDPKLDKKGLLAALKDGKSIDGVTLSNGGTTLNIRGK